MRLYIAEKTSLGRAIAAVLPGSQKPVGKTHIELGNGDIVAWAAGHILEQCPPEAYAEQFKVWNLDTLPIIPGKWLLTVKPGTKDLFYNLKKLLKTAVEVVHAGDPDREGQLLIDEILDFCGYKGPVKRLLINDINPDAVTKALAAMCPNEEFRGVRDCALARSRADWLHGMNLTRCYTKLAQKSGFTGVLKIGRVKTPVVALVVRRDQEIEAFTPKPYTHVSADVELTAGQIRATWVPGDMFSGLDKEGRLCDAVEAAKLKDKLMGKVAAITKSEKNLQKISPPLGYSLPDLQIECSKRYNMPAHFTLAVCQSLYESGIMTYPRSDCRYLPEAHQAHMQSSQIVAHCVSLLPTLKDLSANIDLTQKSQVFNNAKIEEHHAIIPTPKPKQKRDLSTSEEKVFNLVARRYLSFFLPDHEFNQTTIELEIEHEKFKVIGKQITAIGWKIAEGEISDRNPEDDDNKTDDPIVERLPLVQTGDTGICKDVILTDKMTMPPARFTEASLLSAMNNVHKFVGDPEIKKILKEADGIGTAATQANIIKELFEAGQLVKDGKKVLSTETAKALIKALPEEITLPDMTALWEMQFQSISRKGVMLESVMQNITAKVTTLISSAKNGGNISLPSQSQPASRSNKPQKTTRKKNSATTGSKKCQKCGKPMVRRTGKKDGKAYDFFGCSGYPTCRETQKVT